MRESQRQAVNFRLPPAVLAALRKRAKQDRVPMTAVVEAALRSFLDVPDYLSAVAYEIRRRGLKLPSATGSRRPKGGAR